MRLSAFKALATVLILAILIFKVDLWHAFLRLGTLSGIAIATGLLISITQIAVLAHRWQLVSFVIGSRIAFFETLRCMLASQFFSQGLPASIGGDALRVWWLARLGFSTRSALRNVMLDRVAGLVALVVLNVFSVAMLALSERGNASAATVGWIVGATMLLVGVGASRFARRLLIRLLYTLPPNVRRGKSISATARWLVGFQFMIGRLVFSAEGLVILAWGVTVHLCSILLCHVVALDASLEVSLLQLLAVVPPVMLLSYLPLSIGGWGLREGAMAVAFAMIGFPKEDGVFLGLALGSITLGAALLGALVWLLSPMPVTLLGRPRN